MQANHNAEPYLVDNDKFSAGTVAGRQLRGPMGSSASVVVAPADQGSGRGLSGSAAAAGTAHVSATVPTSSDAPPGSHATIAAGTDDTFVRSTVAQAGEKLKALPKDVAVRILLETAAVIGVNLTLAAPLDTAMSADVPTQEGMREVTRRSFADTSVPVDAAEAAALLWFQPVVPGARHGEVRDDKDVVRKLDLKIAEVPDVPAYDFRDHTDVVVGEDGRARVTLDTSNADMFVKKAPVHAFPLDAPARIEKSWGVSTGYPGDFLIVSDVGVHIVDASMFEETYSKVPGSQTLFQKHAPVLARSMHVPFCAKQRGGDEQMGEPGAFLVQEIDNHQYVGDAVTFLHVYKRKILERPAFDKLAMTRTLRRDDTMLSRVAQFNAFDVFALADEELSPLRALLKHVCGLHGLLSKLRIEDHVFAAFSIQLETSYLANAYHNNLHASDVLQGAYAMLAEAKFLDRFEPVELFAGLIAAAAHDVGHPGHTNNYIVFTGHKLALRHNDISVLENFHAARVFEICEEPSTDILSQMTSSMYGEFRKILVDCILATDLARHQATNTEFGNMFANFSAAAAMTVPQKRMLLRGALRCCDISHPTRPRSRHLVWTAKLMEEFSFQAEEERMMGINPTVPAPKTIGELALGQCGFISFLVAPTFRQWSLVSTEASHYVAAMESNLKFWEEIGKNKELAATQWVAGSPLAPILGEPASDAWIVAASAHRPPEGTRELQLDD